MQTGRAGRRKKGLNGRVKIGKNRREEYPPDEAEAGKAGLAVFMIPRSASAVFRRRCGTNSDSYDGP